MQIYVLFKELTKYKSLKNYSNQGDKDYIILHLQPKDTK